MKSHDLFHGNQRRRAFALCIVTALLAPVLILRLFWLQSVRHEQYLQGLEERLTRTVTVPGRRGRILDRNGKVLADTRTVRNISLVDTTDGYDSDADAYLNKEIGALLDVLAESGSAPDDSFQIRLSGTDYRFSVTGWELDRFLADVYGYADPENMTQEERSKTAGAVMKDLWARFGIRGDAQTAEESLRLLQVTAVRWQLSLHAYQKYIPAIVASDVDKETASKVLALSRDYPGISIDTSYARTYTDPAAFSCLIGYMGEATEEEAQNLSGDGDVVRPGDNIGKTGLEASQEALLRGTAGEETILVDSLGRELELVDSLQPEDGADIRLTVDKDLQDAVYALTEQYLAGIILDRMIDQSAVFVADENMSDSQIRIPSGDAYASILLNIVDIPHLFSSGASEEELALKQALLDHAAEAAWIDSGSADSAQADEALERHLQGAIESDRTGIASEFRQMIADGVLTGDLILHAAVRQNTIKVPEDEKEMYQQGWISSYQFLRNRIAQLDITPAQLEVSPCTASAVITDVRTGAVLAMVSYPGYDNNRIHEIGYYRNLLTGQSPLVNTATQLLTAPGSTFKMVSSAAAAGEGITDINEWVYCGGTFYKSDPPPHCWIWPRRHGSLNMEGAIANSCNCYFYEMGYRLGGGDEGSGKKPDDTSGTARLRKYIHYFGLDCVSGVEVEEAEPVPASEDIVRACIGQSDNRYTTAGLARYAAAVATKGTVNRLTLIRSVETSDGTVTETQPEILDTGSEVKIPEETWEAIRNGMLRVVRGEYFFNELRETGVCGKTGTAEHGAGEPSHVLFTGYAPAEDPEIAIAVRIPYGYSSDYAAQLASQILRYYFNVSTLPQLLGENTVGHTVSGD